MLDLRFIMDNEEAVRDNCRNRKVQLDLDRLLELANSRLDLLQRVEALRRRQNEVARSMKGKLPQEDRAVLIEEGRSLKGEVAELDQRLDEAEREIKTLQLTVPNMTHPDVPLGDEEEDNTELKRFQGPTEFSFPSLDHVELGEKLDILDWDSGNRVAGHKFYYLKNEAALLEMALVHYAMGHAMEAGFTPYVTPDLARREVVEGIGFSPRGEETQIYSISDSDLCLVATAEITLGGMLQNQILTEEELPLRLVGVSHCFRTEAGSHGRASRGLYRVHQFTKLEMFAFTQPEDSNGMLEELLGIEERILQGLGIPYRVVDCCTGDLGGSAYRKYDVQAWMPGRSDGGSWGEVTSASNCTDYQARRLGIRYRPAEQKRNQFVHTLNGTAIANSRSLIAVLENFQQEDGSVVVPEVLRPIVGVDVIRPRR